MMTFVVVLCISTVASAAVETLSVYPGAVPDETEPRGNVGDAPAGWGSSSWQGPATGKSNYHVRYNANGDALSILFPTDAATMTINDLASISYYTKRPNATPAGRDWWIQIYTRTDGLNDAASWYGYRFISNYDDHTETDAWTLYSTDSGMTFNRNDKNANVDPGERNLADMKTAYGNELIEMISIQTDSGWNGFDGFVDGLAITLTNENVGRVDLAAVPEPTTLAIWGTLGGLCLVATRRRRRTA